METEEDSVTEPPLTAADKANAPPTPAEIAVQQEQAEKRRMIAQANAGPLTRAIQAKHVPANPHPDAAMRMQMEFRSCPPPPADLLTTPPGDDTITGAVRAACKYLHDQWSDIREASQNRDVSLDQLSRAGQRVLKHTLDPLDKCGKELDIRIADNQREIDAVVMARVDPVLASEIRAAFREKRGGGLDAIRGDVRVASAILSAPNIVLGTTAAQMGQYRDLAEQSHAAEKLARKRHLQKLHLQAARAGKLAVERLRPVLLRWTAQQNEAMKRLMAS